MRLRADEDNARGFEAGAELGVLGKETVAGMQRLGTGFSACFDDAIG